MLKDLGGPPAVARGQCGIDLLAQRGQIIRMFHDRVQHEGDVHSDGFGELEPEQDRLLYYQVYLRVSGRAPNIMAIEAAVSERLIYEVVEHREPPALVHRARFFGRSGSRLLDAPPHLWRENLLHLVEMCTQFAADR